MQAAALIEGMWMTTSGLACQMGPLAPCTYRRFARTVVTVRRSSWAFRVYRTAQTISQRTSAGLGIAYSCLGYPTARTYLLRSISRIQNALGHPMTGKIP